MSVFDCCRRIVEGAGADDDEESVIFVGDDCDRFLSAFGYGSICFLGLSDF